MKRLGILGSTGSIGRNCLGVVADFPDKFQVISLTAGENVELLAQQIVQFRPEFVSMATADSANRLRACLRELGCIHVPEICFGPDGMKQAAILPEVDIVLSSTVGVAGLPATYEAILHGKQVALANKEVMVAAGELVTAAAAANSVELLPVDSEHNAVHQCLRAGRKHEVHSLILTASGGPFLHTPAEEMENVTVEQALRHPTWQMGSRITIDSATMMNKGFEVIEACWLFGFGPQQVRVKVHPQSSIHSMVEFVDGSILAQMSVTDMRLPILYALTYPDRVPTVSHRFDWENLSSLQFHEPDMKRFPCLRLAYEAAAAGGSYTCALNAADEVAVAAFLDRRIPFGAIARLISDVLDDTPGRKFSNMEEVLEHDRLSRAHASERLIRYTN